MQVCERPAVSGLLESPGESGEGGVEHAVVQDPEEAQSLLQVLVPLALSVLLTLLVQVHRR